MPAFDLNAFAAKAGTTTTPQQPLNQDFNKSTTQSFQKAPKAPGFDITKVPSQVGHAITGGIDALGHAIADPFTHLVQNNVTNANVLGENSSIQQAQAGIDKASLDLHKAYASGAVSKSDFQKGLKTLTQHQVDLSNRAGANTVKSNDIKSAEEMAPDALSAIGTVATLGAGGLAKGAAEAALSKAGTIGKVAGKIVDQTIGSGESLGSNIVTKGAGKLVRSALVTNPTLQLANTTVSDAASGDYKGAAENAALAGAAAFAPKILSKVGSVIKDSLFSTHGVFDSVKFADGTVNDYLRQQLAAAEAKGTPAAMNAYKKLENIAKVWQDHALADAQGDHTLAAQQITHRLGGEAVAGETSVKDALKHEATFQTEFRSARAEAKVGGLGIADAGAPGGVRNIEDVSKIGVGRVSHQDLSAISQNFNPASSPEDWKAMFNQLDKNKAFNGNLTLRNQIKSAVDNAKNYDDLRARISDIQTTTPLVRPNVTGSPTLDTMNAADGEKGFVPAASKSGRFHAIQGDNITEVRSPNQVADLVTGKQARFGSFGDAIRKAGLSPEGVAPGVVNNAVREQFITEASKIPGLEGNGGKIYDALRTATYDKVGANDARFLSKGAIADIVQGIKIGDSKIGTGMEGDIRHALDRAYLNISREIRGAGPRIEDQVVAHFPGMRQYLRAQNTGRFSNLNPFYASKVMVKGEAIAQAYGEGAAPLTGSGADRKALSDLVAQAVKGGESNFNTKEYLGSGAGRVSNSLVGRVQQNQAERLTQAILSKNGLKAGDTLSPEVRDAVEHGVQSVYGYPKGGYTSSNLAKTLNLALFPSRFESKVAQAGVHYLSSLEPAARVAVVTDLANAGNWLSSDKGQKWQKDNSELVGIIKYLTPVATIGHVAGAVTHPGDMYVQDLGQIGALPFGIISTVLENQGVDLGHLGSSPYVNPQTGAIQGKSIPESTKARIQQGLSDLVSSLFSYPGKTLGLSSKSSLVQTAIPYLKPGQGETKRVGDGPTPGASGIDASRLPDTIPLSKPINLAPVQGNIPPGAVKVSSRRGKIYARR